MAKLMKYVILPSGISLGIGWFMVRVGAPQKKSIKELKEESPQDYTVDKQIMLKGQDEHIRKEVLTMIDEVGVKGKNAADYWDSYVERKNNAEKQKREMIRKLIKEGRGTQEEVLKEAERLGNPDITFQGRLPPNKSVEKSVT